jgi:hypothetical protein
MPIVLKSGSLNPLKPSGPVKACNGIALPSPYHDERSTKHHVASNVNSYIHKLHNLKMFLVLFGKITQ